jgi:ABC-2 type transport system ATP-binding protein
MTTQPNQAIRVRGLEKSYKKLEVLRGVEFDVAPGSIFALLGSNGAGKTTVVRILSTLLKADAGTASVNGFDVATQPAAVPSPRPAGDRGGARWTAAVAG